MKAKDFEKEGWTQITNEKHSGGWDWEKDGWFIHCMEYGKVEISNAKFETFTTTVPKRFIGFADSIERLDAVMKCLNWEKEA